jgi:hypothetical protein
MQLPNGVQIRKQSTVGIMDHQKWSYKPQPKPFLQLVAYRGGSVLGYSQIEEGDELAELAAVGDLLHRFSEAL